ncbi:hypothetical protein [Frondihabitans sp. PAMC 28766]|uniref:hypothetical protein n=1 Tax=Frondihabitans sp. PAMC 28766 TaxID=1795630 RepID=UPI0012FF6716|nr:hypothetical protein [Frondihabitans sp. PAMC 28766]
MGPTVLRGGGRHPNWDCAERLREAQAGGMEQIRMAAFGLALGLADTAWFVSRNLVARLILEPVKNRRRHEATVPATAATTVPAAVR